MKNIYTTEAKNAAIEMVKAGASVSVAAEMTGVGRITIYKKIRQELPELLATRKQEKREKEKRESDERKARMNVVRLEVEKKQMLSVLLYKEGYTHGKIAEIVGCPVTSVNGYIREFRKGNPDFKTPTAINRLERDKKICELRKSGKTYKAIGEIVGLSEHGTYQICSKYGITAPAKRARMNNGEIPQEILAPLVEYMRRFISAEFAEKVSELAKNMVA